MKLTPSVVRGTLVVAALAVVFPLAACGSKGDEASPSPSTTAAAQAADAVVLHGLERKSSGCHAAFSDDSDLGGRLIGIQGVTKLELCPNDVASETTVVRVTKTDSGFHSLLVALSAPDEPPTSNACTAEATPAAYVVATADGRAYQLKIPVDSCGKYRASAQSALKAARAGTATSPGS